MNITALYIASFYSKIMITHDTPHASLPRVAQEDILSGIIDEFVDPNHKERWEHFSHTNPELMRELLARIVRRSNEDPEVGKMVVDEVTWALGAVERALLRQHAAPQEVNVYNAIYQLTLFDEPQDTTRT